MRISPLTEGNIAYVIGNLSEVSRREAAAFGMGRTELREIFIEKIGGPFTGAIYGEGGNCFALVCMESIGDKKWRTRFVATEEAFSKKTNWFPLTRFLREFSDQIVSDTGAEIEVLSGKENRASRAWFICLGFRHIADDGNISTYFKKAG